MASRKRDRRVKTNPDGSEAQETYLSYLLRLWQAGSAGGKVWRASLESVQSGERLAFAGLEALFEYLRAETGVEAAPEQDPDFGSLPRLPKSTNGKGGADANSVDPEAVDL
jgi:hypothetical protein